MGPHVVRPGSLSVLHELRAKRSTRSMAKKKTARQPWSTLVMSVTRRMRRGLRRNVCDSIPRENHAGGRGQPMNSRVVSVHRRLPIGSESRAKNHHSSHRRPRSTADRCLVFAERRRQCRSSRSWRETEGVMEQRKRVIGDLPAAIVKEVWSWY